MAEVSSYAFWVSSLNSNQTARASPSSNVGSFNALVASFQSLAEQQISNSLTSPLANVLGRHMLTCTHVHTPFTPRTTAADLSRTSATNVVDRTVSKVPNL